MEDKRQMQSRSGCVLPGLYGAQVNAVGTACGGEERSRFGVLWSLCQALGVLNPVLRVRLSLCVLSGLAACILAFASVNFS